MLYKMKLLQNPPEALHLSLKQTLLVDPYTAKFKLEQETSKNDMGVGRRRKQRETLGGETNGCCALTTH
ncbi:hypothetical protein H1R20_g15229, partial [Candolleomyces eurysporus]